MPRDKTSRNLTLEHPVLLFASVCLSAVIVGCASNRPTPDLNRLGDAPLSASDSQPKKRSQNNTGLGSHPRQTIKSYLAPEKDHAIRAWSVQGPERRANGNGGRFWLSRDAAQRYQIKRSPGKLSSEESERVLSWFSSEYGVVDTAQSVAVNQSMLSRDWDYSPFDAYDISYETIAFALISAFPQAPVGAGAHWEVVPAAPPDTVGWKEKSEYDLLVSEEDYLVFRRRTCQVYGPKRPNRLSPAGLSSSWLQYEAITLASRDGSVFWTDSRIASVARLPSQEWWSYGWIELQSDGQEALPAATKALQPLLQRAPGDWLQVMSFLKGAVYGIGIIAKRSQGFPGAEKAVQDRFGAGTSLEVQWAQALQTAWLDADSTLQRISALELAAGSPDAILRDAIVLLSKALNSLKPESLGPESLKRLEDFEEKVRLPSVSRLLLWAYAMPNAEMRKVFRTQGRQLIAKRDVFDDLPGLRARAAFEAGLGDWEKARELTRQALASQCWGAPQMVQPLRNDLKMYFEQKEHRRTDRYLNILLGSDWRMVPPYILEDPWCRSQAIEPESQIGECTLVPDPSQKPPPKWSRINSPHGLLDCPSSDPKLLSAIKHPPQSIRTRWEVQRAASLALRLDYSGALEAYEKVYAISPDSGLGLSIAWLLVTAKQPTAANTMRAQLLVDACDEEASLGQYDLIRAATLAASGQFEEAIELLERVNDEYALVPDQVLQKLIDSYKMDTLLLDPPLLWSFL